MHGDLLAAVDAFDRALAAADGLVDPEVLDPLAVTVREVRSRAGYLGDTVVAAVAGGTGSGKSSLVNALADEVVTESGGMRPTTGIPLAWIPANPEPGLIRLLDDLGVTERVGQDRHDWLALIDLPDTDSVVVDHRHTVEALLPRVDLVLWVIDPEKYQDRVLHHHYIRPLAAYARQFVFVLNQIDRLSGDTVAELKSDLRESLVADGIDDPLIVTVAADPTVGPPIGVDELVAVLEERVDVKRLVYDKLATDLSEAAGRLAGVPALSGGVGFDDRWSDVRREAAEALAGGDRRAAERRLSSFVDELASDAGDGASQLLRDEVTPAAVKAAVEVAFESSGAFRVPEPPRPPSWFGPLRWLLLIAAVGAGLWTWDRLRGGESVVWPVVVLLVALAGWIFLGAWMSSWRTRAGRRLLDEHRTALVEPIARQFDAQLGRPMRGVLRRRAGATAAATELNLALAELDRRLGR